MRKTALLLVLILACSLLVFTSCATKGSQGLKYMTNGDGTCAVVGIGECTDTDLVIPQKSPDGDLVTSIGVRAFSGCTGLKSVTIGDNVTRIGQGAFSYCTGLTSIMIPDNVTYIDLNVFSYCTDLTSVNVSEGNSVYHSVENCIIETETGALLAGCKTSRIPDSANSIVNGAFEGCTGLTSITIPDNVTSIWDGAFARCADLTNIIVSEGNPVYHSEENCIIETASGDLIVGCKTSRIPDSVTSISDSAFYGCTDLMSVTIPDSVTSIGDSAFFECTGLTSIIIPDSVTIIEEHAFGHCTGLTSITIPDSITGIDYSLFWCCSGLTSVTIPKSVTSIGVSTFYGCTNLTDIYYTGTEQEWALIKVDDNSEALANATIHYNYVPEE